MMKHKTLSIMLAMFMSMVACVASADSFEIDGICYFITSSTDLTVGVMSKERTYYSGEYEGNLIIPETVTYGGKSYRVTSIDNHAFDGCSSLTSISIPNTVIRIGMFAFQGCSGLTFITIPSTIGMISTATFSGCSSLVSITIPNSVIWIGSDAFAGCSGLESIVVEKDNPKYDSREGCNAIIETSTNELVVGCKNSIIPSSVTSIGSSAFSGCSSLTSITIPNRVTSIGSSAFSGCNGLESIVVEENNPKYDSREGCNAIIETSTNELVVGCKNSIIPNSVTSIGKSAFAYCSGLTSVAIPNSVTSIGSDAFYDCSGLTSITIPNSVTSIGDYAFRGCSGLTSITIPNSVTSIGYYEFSRCTGLTSITIPNSVISIDKRAFEGCSGLTSVTIGNSVTSIGSFAFKGCDGLTSVTINSNTIAAGGYSSSQTLAGIFGSQVTEYVFADDVKSIGNYACYNCRNLSSLVIGNSVTSVGSYAFSGCSSLISITIPNNVTSIGSSSFSDCSSLTFITIPNSVTSIGSSAFRGCNGLTSVIIPNSVTSIGSGAFLGCTGLTSVTINSNIIASQSYSSSSTLSQIYGSQVTEYVFGDDVKSIGNYACYNCRNLSSLVIGNSVTSVGSYAFSGCSSLTSITIPNRVTSIGSFAFSDCNGLESIIVEENNPKYDSREGCNAIIETSTNELVVGCKNSIIPSNVTSIGCSAFSGCSSLTSVTIPNSVTSIGSSAFDGCSSLTSITIPNSVTLIGEFAFYDCSGLTSVTIPNSVTSISNAAFYGCSGLTSITIPNSLTLIDNYAFYGCRGLTNITIPKSVTSIGSDAFAYCTGLTSVTINSNIIASKSYSSSSTLSQIYGSQVTEYVFGDDVKSIGNHACYNCKNLTSLIIGNSVTSVGSYAFMNCSNLTSISIPSSVTNIGSNAFEGCKLQKVVICDLAAWCEVLIDGYAANPLSIANHLYSPKNDEITTLTIPNGVKTISSYAFAGCSGLTSINIPNTVTNIGNSAFYGCSALTSINIPSSVTNIGSYAFYGCSALTSIKIPNSVTNIGRYAFAYCGGLASMDIPKSVISIGERALYYCSNLLSITVPNASIGEEAFKGCDAVKVLSLDCERIDNWFEGGLKELKMLTLGNNVKVISPYAFEGCSSAIRINIGKNIEEIGNRAFANWKKLEDVYCYAVRYPTTGEEVFEGSYMDYATLHVPAESLQNYKNRSPWSGFKDIVPIDETANRDVIIPTAGYGTFYDSQAAYAIPSSLKALVVKTIADNKLTLEEIKGSVVPKGVAVMLKSELQGGTFMLTRVEDDTRYTGTNLLHGSDETTMTTASEDSYFYKLTYGATGSELADVFGWYWGAANGDSFFIEGHKAWLAIPKEQARKIRAFSIDGTATAIADLEGNKTESADNAVYYDLQGRRISQPTRNGVYICNGKKVAFIK